MKKIFFLIILFSLFFGCTFFEEINENEFIQLRKEYSLEESFSPDLILMNSYLNEISLLRSNTSGGLAKNLDFEIHSAQAFVYFSRALNESKKINYSIRYCSTIEYLNTISYLNLSIKHSEKAKKIIFFPNEINLSRENQDVLVKEINNLSKELFSIVSNPC